MFNRIKEYFRNPQIGDIWYLSFEDPFIKPIRFIIIDIRNNWVQIENISLSNELHIQMSRRNMSIRQFKYMYKREI
jgi:hypothetical protein